VKDQDIKSPVDVSAEWLKDILEAQGYNIELDQKGDPNLFRARHDRTPNLILHLLPDINLISIVAIFARKKVSWGKKTKFLTALNKANFSHLLCSFHLTESMDSVYVSSFIYLTERISSRDVVMFLEAFSIGTYKAFEVSGLNEL
jgi:hypothetical protein